METGKKRMVLAVLVVMVVFLMMGGEVMGSICEDNGDCGGGYYCAKSNCDDPSGTCVERPGICLDLYDPVCGCDAGRLAGTRVFAFPAGALSSSIRLVPFRSFFAKRVGFSSLARAVFFA